MENINALIYLALKISVIALLLKFCIYTFFAVYRFYLLQVKIFSDDTAQPTHTTGLKESDFIYINRLLAHAENLSTADYWETPKGKHPLGRLRLEMCKLGLRDWRRFGRVRRRLQF